VSEKSGQYCSRTARADTAVAFHVRVRVTGSGIPQVATLKFVGADGVAFTGTMLVVCINGVKGKPEDEEAPLFTPGM
jgi:hypothetical protein